MATHKTKPPRKKQVTTKKTALKSDKKVAAKKNPHVLNRIGSLIKQHKLLTFLFMLLSLAPISWGYERYKDWDNAQFIKGLSTDFPELVSQIEAETGLELPIKVECMTTGEKFTGGVRVCEVSTGYYKSERDIKSQTEKIILNWQYASLVKKFENSDGYEISYRNKKSCDTWSVNEESFIVRCITAVREANVQLAKDVLVPLNEQ